MALRCEKGIIPYVCQQPVAEQCVYCGRHFCTTHGHVDKGCCKSLSCMSLYRRDRAVVDRQHWEEERQVIGIERNNMALCAQPECQNSIYVPCGHCEQLYCADHLKRYNFTFRTYTRRNVSKVAGDIMLCEVCVPYLKEYKRDRYE